MGALLFTGMGRRYSFNRIGRGFEIEMNFQPVEKVLTRAQMLLDKQVAHDIQRYVPMLDHHLVNTINKENEIMAAFGDMGHVLVYNTEAVKYAHYQYEGKVYVDPVYRCGGFFIPEVGWKSRRGVQKVPTSRPLRYGGGNPEAHDHWDQYALNRHYSRWFDMVKRFIEEQEKNA